MNPFWLYTVQYDGSGCTGDIIGSYGFPVNRCAPFFSRGGRITGSYKIYNCSASGSCLQSSWNTSDCSHAPFKHVILTADCVTTKNSNTGVVVYSKTYQQSPDDKIPIQADGTVTLM